MNEDNVNEAHGASEGRVIEGSMRESIVRECLPLLVWSFSLQQTRKLAIAADGVCALVLQAVHWKCSCRAAA